MLGSVAQLFREAAVLFKDKINFKLPGGDGFKAHQDVQAGWDAYASVHITAMLSIDRTTAENGWLEMAPRQHERGLTEGDQRARYYADKRKSYPPDCERVPGKEYVFRV